MKERERERMGDDLSYLLRNRLNYIMSRRVQSSDPFLVLGAVSSCRRDGVVRHRENSSCVRRLTLSSVAHPAEPGRDFWEETSLLLSRSIMWREDVADVDLLCLSTREAGKLAVCYPGGIRGIHRDHKSLHP